MWLPRTDIALSTVDQHCYYCTCRGLLWILPNESWRSLGQVPPGYSKAPESAKILNLANRRAQACVVSLPPNLRPCSQDNGALWAEVGKAKPPWICLDRSFHEFSQVPVLLGRAFCFSGTAVTIFCNYRSVLLPVIKFLCKSLHYHNIKCGSRFDLRSWRFVVCARLVQLVRSLTANRKVPSSILGLVEGWTLGDLLSPHRPWTGTLSHWSSLSTCYQGT